MSGFKTDNLFEAEKTDDTLACNHIIRVAFESSIGNEFYCCIVQKGGSNTKVLSEIIGG